VALRSVDDALAEGLPGGDGASLPADGTAAAVAGHVQPLLRQAALSLYDMTVNRAAPTQYWPQLLLTAGDAGLFECNPPVYTWLEVQSIIELVEVRAVVRQYVVHCVCGGVGVSIAPCVCVDVHACVCLRAAHVSR
jgi:hypothetical protein